MYTKGASQDDMPRRKSRIALQFEEVAWDTLFSWVKRRQSEDAEILGICERIKGASDTIQVEVAHGPQEVSIECGQYTPSSCTRVLVMDGGVRKMD